MGFEISDLNAETPLIKNVSVKPVTGSRKSPIPTIEDETDDELDESTTYNWENAKKPKGALVAGGAVAAAITAVTSAASRRSRKKHEYETGSPSSENSPTGSGSFPGSVGNLRFDCCRYYPRINHKSF